ncbi:MAG TPA: hypothetical protein VNB64_07115, partial [Solirubrobacteraceae bacterium]|nr:hypothetical protein [Solirubrobacteraceae bacterium]
AQPAGRRLARWWDGRSRAERFAAGALSGAALAWTVFLARFPAFGWDGVVYHLPEVVRWVQEGTPGSIEDVLPGWPVGNYPLVNEVLLAWGAGIARAYTPVIVWPTATIALLGVAGWTGLRAVGVGRTVRALAVGVLCTLPVLSASQLHGPNTDLPALAWLVATAALAAAAVRRDEPALLAPALVAGALAAGTKTTALPLAALALGLAAFALRDRLRSLVVPLAAASAAAVAIGGTWYLRNLIDHGTPFWPFFTTAWSDPPPDALSRMDVSFLERPRATLREFGLDEWLGKTFAGGALMLACGALAGLAVRSRAALAASAVTVVSLLLWANAPVTGVSDLRGVDGATISTVRYLLPGVAAAAVAVALASRAGRRARQAAVAVLVVVLGLNLWQLFDLGFPAAPSWRMPLGAALIGGALAAASAWIPLRARLPSPLLAAATVVAALGLGLAAPGVVERHRRMNLFDAELVRVFEGPAGDGRTIAMAPMTLAVLSGPDLERRVDGIPRRESCARLRERAERGWVVVAGYTAEELFGPTTVPACVRTWRPRFAIPNYRIYGPGSAPAA